MDDLTDYFRAQIRRYGDDARSAGWVSRASQERRFAVVAELVHERDSVLDVGCGPGHLYDYLRERGWSGEYAGIDPLPEMVAVAEAAGRPATVGDLSSIDAGTPQRYDVVVSSGVVSMQLGSDEHRRSWLAGHLRAAAGHARRTVVVNFLSARYRILETPDRWFARPGLVVEEALEVVRRVTVRHDYYEDIDCTVVLHVGEGSA